MGTRAFVPLTGPTAMGLSSKRHEEADMPIVRPRRPTKQIQPRQLPKRWTVDLRVAWTTAGILPNSYLQGVNGAVSWTGESTLFIHGTAGPVDTTGHTMTWSVDVADLDANPLLENDYHLTGMTTTVVDDRLAVPYGGCLRQYEERARALTKQQLADPQTRWLSRDPRAPTIELTVSYVSQSTSYWNVQWSVPYAVSGKYQVSTCSTWYQDREGTGTRDEIAWWLTGNSGAIYRPKFDIDLREKTLTAVHLAHCGEDGAIDHPALMPGAYAVLAMQTYPSYEASSWSKEFTVVRRVSVDLVPDRP